MILCYHSVTNQSSSPWAVTVENFVHQILLIKSKYEFCYLDDYIDGNKLGKVVLTFDDAFQSIQKNAIPFLRSLNLPFEVFVSGDYVDRYSSYDGNDRQKICSLYELHSIAESGGRLQWHGKSHLDLSKIVNRNELISEMTVSKYLADEFIKFPDFFRWVAYPYSNPPLIGLDIVQRSFRGALACENGMDNERYNLRRFQIGFRHDYLMLTDIFKKY